MNKLTNKIMCIKREIFFKDGKWQGINTENLQAKRKLLIENYEFKERGPLETDLNYLQIIPQIIFKYQDKYFIHFQERITEKRLEQMYPLFVGGHVEEFDLQENMDVIEVAIEREVDEEVFLEAQIINKTFAGLIYIEDDKNPVNHFHVGLIYVYEIDSPNVRVKEDGLVNGEFVDIEFLTQNINQLTFWSREYIKSI